MTSFSIKKLITQVIKDYEEIIEELNRFIITIPPKEKKEDTSLGFSYGFYLKGEEQKGFITAVKYSFLKYLALKNSCTNTPFNYGTKTLTGVDYSHKSGDNFGASLFIHSLISKIASPCGSNFISVSSLFTRISLVNKTLPL